MTFAQAAEEHLDDVYGYLAWFTGARAAAECLAGETFERALRLWHRFDPDRGSARTWLCQVARTVALDHFRSERRPVPRGQLGPRPLQIGAGAGSPRAASRPARGHRLPLRRGAVPRRRGRTRPAQRRRAR